MDVNKIFAAAAAPKMSKGKTSNVRLMAVRDEQAGPGGSRGLVTCKNDAFIEISIPLDLCETDFAVVDRVGLC